MVLGRTEMRAESIRPQPKRELAKTADEGYVPPSPGDTMARVTVEDCLDREENRFALVVLAAGRARELMKGTAPLVASKNKPAVTALREVAAGKVKFSEPTMAAVVRWIEAQKPRS